ncbi:MAG TPA: hypothetical protein VK139_08150 [Microbacteriaceae bacterium]|nr:hypothetical protein [Microbacteriaceae bacterium]
MDKRIAALGVGVLSAGSLLAPAIANADVADCGTFDGATVTEANGVCQAVYDTAGEYTFTVPTGVTSLAIIAAGGGGGAYVDGSLGYSGSGGKVAFADLTSTGEGDELSITVGAGGASGSGGVSNGESSVVTDTVDVNVVADGGQSGGYDGDFCRPGGVGTGVTLIGSGAGGRAVLNGNACDAAAPGLNPAVDLTDNYTNSLPEIFADFGGEFGKGGSLVVAPGVLESGVGQGGGIQWDLDNDTTSSYSDGVAGMVVLRWIPGVTETPSPSATGSAGAALATTGTPASGWLSPAAGLVALGSVGLVATRRKSRLV